MGKTFKDRQNGAGDRPVPIHRVKEKRKNKDWQDTPVFYMKKDATHAHHRRK